MFTPLKKTALHELLNKPILFDANIFMVGISERTSDKNSSFENMKQLYIIPLFESFTDIYIHEEVYKELDDESRKVVDGYKGKTVTIVGEGDLYGKDPKYTVIFNNIARHELVNYQRGRSKLLANFEKFIFLRLHLVLAALFMQRSFRMKNFHILLPAQYMHCLIMGQFLNILSRTI